MSEVDATLTPAREGGMVLAYLATSQRGPTTEAEGAPALLRSTSDVYRVCGTNPAIPKALGKLFKAGGVAHFVRVVGAGAVKGHLDCLDAQTPTPAPCLLITATSPGDWSEDVDVTIIAEPGDAGAFRLTTAYSPDPNMSREWQNLSMHPSAANFVERVINGVDPLITVTALSAFMPAVITASPLSAGTADDTPAVADYEAPCQLFNGDRALTHIACDSTSSQVWSYLDSYAASKGTMSCLFQVPRTLTAAQAVQWRSGSGGYGFSNIDSSYSYLFWNGIMQADAGAINPTPQDVLADVLGLCAASHAQGKPWLAFSGLKRGIIPGAKGVILNVLDTSDQQVICDAQINPVVWDRQRQQAYINDVLTCRKVETQLQQYPVREGLNWIKRRFFYHASEFIFDPNEPASWIGLYQRMKVDLDIAGTNGCLDGAEGSGYVYMGDQNCVRRQDAKFNEQASLRAGKYAVGLGLIFLGVMRQINLVAILGKSSIDFKETVAQ